MISKKCLVGGRVQGVYYRATTANRARELGVTGYARNLPDGRVEVLAVGEASAVNALIEWLWEGSSASKVTSVEASEIELHESAAADSLRDALTGAGVRRQSQIVRAVVARPLVHHEIRIRAPADTAVVAGA